MDILFYNHFKPFDFLLFFFLLEPPDISSPAVTDIFSLNQDLLMQTVEELNTKLNQSYFDENKKTMAVTLPQVIFFFLRI